MEFLTELWLGILLSAAAVFFWSFLSHAVLPVHAKDFIKLPDEQRFMDTIRSMGIQPGYYSYPHMSHKDCKTPEGKARFMAGPMGLLHAWSPNFNMGRNMALTFLVYLVVSVFMAYVGSLALPKGGTFMEIWQITGTLGVMAYCFAFLPGMIWHQVPCRAVFTNLIDGVIQGLVAGAVFAACWPEIVSIKV